MRVQRFLVLMLIIGISTASLAAETEKTWGWLVLGPVDASGELKELVD